MSPPPAIDTERLRRLYALLDVALDLPLAERNSWLQGLGPEHQALVPRLRVLLAGAGVETDDMLQRPALAQLLQQVDQGLQPDKAGQAVGPYRLLEEIGSGGMATVWLAERTDGSLDRKVALKLPRVGFRPGLMQRMARERDLLAALEHPHIARLYDAGITSSGRPWLAMERVQGQAIGTWCREHAPGVPQILRLVLQVCDALAHAHARLIVHRDLKPDNILVTAQGEVRLVDFGVGKLLQDDERPAGHLTQELGQALTPEYASPEQAAGLPLTVATDVYSLGVVMYELLTGERPYRIQTQGAAALQAAILTADIPRASQRAPAATRARALRGDLDAVLATALAKDPARRYRSADALAEDLRRHLHGDAVQARRQGWLQAAARRLQRHQRPLLAGTLGLAMLAIGVGAGAATLVAAVATAGAAVAVWQAKRARHGQQVAEEAARRAQAVRESLLDLFRLGGHAHAGRRADELSLREALDLVREQLDQRLAAFPEDRVLMLTALGDVYESLEEPDIAFDLYECALKLADDEPAVARCTRMLTLTARLTAAFTYARYDRFEQWLREYEHEAQRLAGQNQGLHATAIYLRTRWQHWQRDPDYGPGLVADRMSEVERMFAQHDPVTPLRAHAAAFGINALLAAGRPEEALELADVLVGLERRRPDAPTLLADALSMRGLVCVRLRRGGPARADLDEATTLYEQHSGREHFLTLQNQVLQGHAWVLDGEPDAGLAHARLAAEGISRKRAGETKEAMVLTWLGRTELDAGQSQAAAATLDRAVALVKSLQAPARGAEAGLALVKAHAANGDPAQAREVLAWVDGPATPPEGLNGQQQQERREALAALRSGEP